MTVEILPSGIKCNLSCSYCYQEPMRQAGNFGAPLTFHKVIEALDKTNQSFSLFGGEALLTPIETLEKFLKYGLDRFNRNAIQTNGLLITQEHIDLFKKYNVGVGISIDGPAELNKSRSKTCETNKIISNIFDTIKAGVGVSLIVTIHRDNASKEVINQLTDFLLLMEAYGVQYINLHNLEDNNNTGLVLSDEENYYAFRTIYEFCKTTRLNVVPFRDIIQLLTVSNPIVSCIWTGCDPCTTPAVHGIGPDGSLVNCGRTNKDGVDFLKVDGESRERYLALAYTDCKDCQYFFVCKGQCPGTAIDGDWRRKTKDCVFWYRLIDYIAEDLIIREEALLNFKEENEKFIKSLSNTSSNGHGDIPHGDYHGDHTDLASTRTRPTV